MANNSEILGEEAAVRQIVENDFSATNGHFEDDSITSLRQNAFYGKTGLTSASFPNVAQLLSGNVFRECSNLTNLEMPKLTKIVDGDSFRNVKSSLTFPLLTTIPGSNCFTYWKGTLMDIGSGLTSSIGAGTYNYCTNMIALVLRKSSLVALGNVSAFSNTKYATTGAGGAYVYVPRDLISTYQSATNWATLYAAHSDMFRALEDYTVDGTTTGDFDESLI